MKRLLLAILITLALGGQGWGADWYVRPISGEYGAEDGTTYATAYDGFAGITWGVGGVVAGDVLWVCGTHSEYFNVGASGVAGSPITIRFDYSGDPGVMSVAAAMAHGLRISAISYVDIIGGEFTGGTADGIGAINASDHIRLIGVKCYGNLTGINITGSTDCEVFESEIYSNTDSGIKGTDGSNALHIHYNIVRDNGTTGAANNHDGIFVGNASQNIIVEHNTVFNQKGGLGTGIDCSGSAAGSASAIVRYNMVYNGEFRAFGASGDLGNSDTFTFHNNLAYGHVINVQTYEWVTAYFYNNTFGNAITYSIEFYNNGAQNITFKNNIVGGTYAHAIHTDPDTVTLDSNYNCFGGDGSTAFGNYDGTNKTFAEWKASTGGDSASIISDPLFLDSANDNFHLRYKIPGTNDRDGDGNPDTGYYDLDGYLTPRQGNYPTVGAYDFRSPGRPGRDADGGGRKGRGGR